MFKHRRGGSTSNLLGQMLNRYMASMGMMLFAVDLEDPEVKGAIKEAVTAAVSEATEGLLNKNKELLADIKKLRKGAEIKPEDVEALETELETLKGEKTKLEKENKTFKTELEKVTTTLASESAYTHKLLVENGLTEAFGKAGVKDSDHLELLVGKFAQQGKVVVDGDTRKVMIGDKDKDSFMKEWAQTDSAKKFIQADHNSGGGANGGGASGAPSKPLSDWTSAEKAKYIGENGIAKWNEKLKSA